MLRNTCYARLGLQHRSLKEMFIAYSDNPTTSLQKKKLILRKPHLIRLKTRNCAALLHEQTAVIFEVRLITGENLSEV